MAALGGGGGHYGQPFREIDKGLEAALGTFRKFGAHRGLPGAGDVPMLIKALGMTNAAVAEEAHRSLVWLSGEDLGWDPEDWRAWWQANGDAITGEHADSTRPRVVNDRLHRLPTRPAHRPRRRSVNLGFIVAVIVAAGLVFGAISAMASSRTDVGNTIFLVGGLVALACAPLTIIYCMVFGRMRSARDIREEFRAKQGQYLPGARGRR
jgi:hypothetical protein